MSELIIDLETATPVVLRAAIKMCQALLGEQDDAARAVATPYELDTTPGSTTITLPPAAVGATIILPTASEGSAGLKANVAWVDEAQHIQQEHVDSLAVHMESKQAGSPVGVVTTFNPPVGLPPEFVVTNGIPAEFSPGVSPAGVPVGLPFTPGTAELDSAGVPWDDRIHSQNKTKLANGNWRPKKGVDDAFKRQVLNEVLTNTNAPVHADPVAMDWQQLLQRIVAKQMNKELDIIAFNQWLVDHNVQGGVSMLSLRQDLWNQVITIFGV